MEVFEKACENSANPLCYNGDLCTAEEIQRFGSRYPQVKAVMIGRGILKNPGLVGEVKGHEKAGKERLRKFHDQIYHDYRSIMSGDKNTVFKMKEFWSYLISSFEEGEKCWKKIKKSQTAAAYEAAVEEVFSGYVS